MCSKSVPNPFKHYPITIRSLNIASPWPSLAPLKKDLQKFVPSPASLPGKLRSCHTANVLEASWSSWLTILYLSNILQPLAPPHAKLTQPKENITWYNDRHFHIIPNRMKSSRLQYGYSTATSMTFAGPAWPCCLYGINLLQFLHGVLLLLQTRLSSSTWLQTFNWSV